jgi:hypothetical protein
MYITKTHTHTQNVRRKKLACELLELVNSQVMGDPDPSVYIFCNVPYTEGDDDVCELMKYVDGINSTCARHGSSHHL